MLIFYLCSFDIVFVHCQDYVCGAQLLVVRLRLTLLYLFCRRHTAPLSLSVTIILMCIIIIVVIITVNLIIRIIITNFWASVRQRKHQYTNNQP